MDACPSRRASRFLRTVSVPRLAFALKRTLW
ncbi:MAG: hypothetical protein ACI9U2_003345, partial [Bradymonadia bacterium]